MQKRMNPILKDVAIQAYLRKLVGDDGIKIIGKLPKKESTDEEIAKLTDAKLNLVRRTLYILYENHIAEYRCERNDENGWLTYLWSFNFDRLDDIVRSESTKLMNNLTERLEYERGNLFYTCKNSNKRYRFDSVASTGFRCPECDSELNHTDNQNIIHAIEKKIAELGKSVK